MKTFLLTALGVALLASPGFAKDPVKKFLKAAEKGNLEKMAACHVHVDVRDHEGETALMEASEAGQVGAVLWLLDHGARVNLQDDEGETALYQAAEEGHLEVARLLLDHWADASVADAQGWTPLHVAVAEDQPEMVALLLRRGAPIGTIDWHGRTAADLAREKPGILELLKMAGAR